MEIETTIRPRRDGTVIVRVEGATYTFRSDAEGRFVADVPSDDHVSQLLITGNFVPAQEADFDKAASLAVSIQSEDDMNDDEGDDDDIDLASGAALPIEANTPPKPAKPGKAKPQRKPA